MKIKKINDIDNIELRLNHEELILIKEALLTISCADIDIEILNDSLFDKDEFKNSSKVYEKIEKMLKKINKKIKNIYPY